ncbi:MAG: hypothetical protein IT369_20720 [Candidatus Latescibacteria bacterium]|nr:hypothetical protein [Candidatus Latescibacterota bacterium]
MRLDEAKALYPGEWVAFSTVEEGDNPAGEVSLHNKDRRVFDQQLLERGLTGVYITFTGSTVPDNYAVMF